MLWEESMAGRWHPSPVTQSDDSQEEGTQVKRGSSAKALGQEIACYVPVSELLARTQEGRVGELGTARRSTLLVSGPP